MSYYVVLERLKIDVGENTGLLFTKREVTRLSSGD
jgi:hypothetical protein